MMRKLICAAVTVATLLLSDQAMATTPEGTTTGTLTVTGYVPANCSVASTTLSIGDVTAGAVGATTNIPVTCNANASDIALTIDASGTPQLVGTYNSNNTISISLFAGTNASGTALTTAAAAIPAVTSGGVTTFPIYAKTASGAPKEDSYTATFTLTLTY